MSECTVEIIVERAVWHRQTLEVQLHIRSDVDQTDLKVICPLPDSGAFWSGRVWVVDLRELSSVEELDDDENGEENGT